MKIPSENSKEKSRNTWKSINISRYQFHVTISPTGSAADEKAVYMEDLEKRKKAYGLCGECNEPGTGEKWCQPCNVKRFEKNFKNWTSGNEIIDEFIQKSQLGAVHYKKCLEWIPFEKLHNVTYVAKGGYGKVHSARWPEGCINYWDIEKQEWARPRKNMKVALKSLDNSSDISSDFLNEINTHLQLYLHDVIQCYGITQEPNAKDYMMVLQYCDDGNLRDYLDKSGKSKLGYNSKIDKLFQIARGLLDIHNAGKIHKDFHSGNILSYARFGTYISDLGMCQPANSEEQSDKRKGIYGVLPYMAPEVLCRHPYTKASDIYSFGIIMNEFMSEEIPYSDIPHDFFLAVKICDGLRPKISDDTPKLLADLIMKCLDAQAENRPTAKELHDTLRNWFYSKVNNKHSKLYSQIKECEKIRERKLKNISLNENEPRTIQTHPQAVYTSRLLNFENLPKPVNSTNLSSFQITSGAILQSPPSDISSIDPFSECLDAQLTELDLRDSDENDKNNII